MTDLLYVENMRVSQAKIHEGDANWYVVNAAGHVVRGPFSLWGSAQASLDSIRRRARAEADPED